MRLFYLLFILIAFNGCKTKSESIKQNQHKLTKTACPEDGACKAEVQQNKQLLVKTEEATGLLYPKLDHGENLVIQFEYNKKVVGNVADVNYSETIHFEVPKDFIQLNKKNKELTELNLLYGKHCFCEGAGYYRVSEGELSVKKQDNKLSFELQFEVEGNKQVIKHIIETLEIE